jgi:hypothetical protein
VLSNPLSQVLETLSYLDRNQTYHEVQKPGVSSIRVDCLILPDWLLTSALKLFGQISVTAFESWSGYGHPCLQRGSSLVLSSMSPCLKIVAYGFEWRGCQENVSLEILNKKGNTTPEIFRDSVVYLHFKIQFKNDGLIKCRSYMDLYPDLFGKRSIYKNCRNFL